ncbi:uncharacterized protein BT62DRAFT_457885 [Guyanagaster necrorhizus]|uniref:F-box domain-containing protein n=1 Tax=Guyanagaster necrorhizus TaxID=856835 RepID=A0A9P8ANN7_9AGAR|nr:uncharacterized protein BT62DRAFT_457885 [Guyanagaster necrorhizus MCA 3950]KAG7442115.1 hypothetical protein BT62DRAFT_457885 [Guyanagaster necrorhizus MCA 3950]
MENTLADLVNALSNSNQCPSDDDTTRIAFLLTRTDERLSECCDSIRALQDDFRETVVRYHTALDKALMLRKELVKTKSIYATILAPVRRLPTEILIQIFLHSIGRHFTLFSITRGPWVLGKVCSRWRQVVLSTPELWSVFTLFPRGNPRLLSNPTVLISLLDTALRLSGQRNICIYADVSIGRLKDAVEDIWKHLSLHSHRWKDIRLQMADSFAPLDAVPKDGLPALEKLSLSMVNSMHDHPCDALNNSPRLTNLTLINDGGSLMTAGLPWHQLTHLALLSRGTLPEVLRLLRLSPRLQVLEALGTRIQDSWAVPLERVPHPSLRRLQVSDVMIPQHLILPALDDLDLVGITNKQRCADIICSLIARSKNILRKFRVVCDMSLYGVMNALKAMPELAELTVEAPEMEEWFVKDFLQTKDFLLSLQKVSLTIGNFTPSREASTILVDAIERRWSCTMRSCYISAPFIFWHIADDDVVRIRKMQEDGLDLTIRYANRRVL